MLQPVRGEGYEPVSKTELIQQRVKLKILPLILFMWICGHAVVEEGCTFGYCQCITDPFLPLQKERLYLQIELGAIHCRTLTAGLLCAPTEATSTEHG